MLILLQIVTEQIAREARIRDLWTTVGDILDRVGALGKHKDEPVYKKKVEVILKQIYECVLFLRWYAEKGFGGTRSCLPSAPWEFIGVFLARLVRDPFSGTDDAIKGFEKAFKDLWTSLQDIFSADLIRNTYQLVATAERIATMGPLKVLIIPFWFSCVF